VALPVLLRHRDVFDAQAAEIRRERARMVTALGNMRVDVFASQANFVLVRVPDARAADAALRAARILVKNLDGAHTLLANCLRITVGTPDENDALLDALDRHLGGRR
jgi:histidinol-phosphate aminotransferase